MIRPLKFRCFEAGPGNLSSDALTLEADQEFGPQGLGCQGLEGENAQPTLVLGGVEHGCRARERGASFESEDTVELTIPFLEHAQGELRQLKKEACLSLNDGGCYRRSFRQSISFTLQPTELPIDARPCTLRDLRPVQGEVKSSTQIDEDELIRLGLDGAGERDFICSRARGPVETVQREGKGTRAQLRVQIGVVQSIRHVLGLTLVRDIVSRERHPMVA